MAARAAQEAQILSPAQVREFIERHGVVAESARRPGIACLADAIAGETIRGSWWSHPKGRAIFAITRALRDDPQVLVCRLVDGKISYVHERLWPALARLADRIPHARLARVREVHTESGKHRLEETPFPDWLPDDLNLDISTEAARALLQPVLGDSIRPGRSREAPKSTAR